MWVRLWIHGTHHAFYTNTCMNEGCGNEVSKYTSEVLFHSFCLNNLRIYPIFTSLNNVFLYPCWTCPHVLTQEFTGVCMCVKVRACVKAAECFWINAVSCAQQLKLKLSHQVAFKTGLEVSSNLTGDEKPECLCVCVCQQSVITLNSNDALENFHVKSVKKRPRWIFIYHLKKHINANERNLEMNLEGSLNDSYIGINYIKTMHKSSMFSYLALS